MLVAHHIPAELHGDEGTDTNSLPEYRELHEEVDEAAWVGYVDEPVIDHVSRATSAG
jgi:hypothetical protein